MRIAVVAHIGSTLGGGLEELRAVLAAEGETDARWHEISDISAASELARQARAEGAELIFVWGAMARCSAVSMDWPTPEPR